MTKPIAQAIAAIQRSSPYMPSADKAVVQRVDQ